MDDILVLSRSVHAREAFLKKFRERFKDITIHTGNQLTYLGMHLTLDRVNRSCYLDMNDYVADILRDCNVKGKSKNPHDSHLFSCAVDNVMPVDAPTSKWMHSTLMRILYVAKRGRPDLLTACSFLATRVNVFTTQDYDKLMKILHYMNHVPTKWVVLSIGDKPSVRCFVDASYATHHDMKSHTGYVLAIGNAPVLFRSVKQKLNSKSSTEAELYALSEASSDVLWFKHLLESLGYDYGPAIIFEDNQSTITMLNSGPWHNKASKHVLVRYFFVQDHIASHEINVKFVPTSKMLADVFTKPITGKQFHLLMSSMCADPPI